MDTNIQSEIDTKMKGFENFLQEKRINQERDSLILALAVKLYGPERVQRNYPNFYQSCMEAKPLIPTWQRQSTENVTDTTPF